ncbi:MAG: TonB-dependent receptor [Bacteroidetes bacterium]|nr:TonB-dependent receptor [Bacteroidota bacterium]
MKNSLIPSLLMLFILGFGMAKAKENDLTQTVRGKVIDIDTKMPLIGANIFILESNPPMGAVTNVNGDFRLDNVPVGRHSLKISYIGYEEKMLPNLLVSSAKEVVLTVEMQESVIKAAAVIITASKHKSEVQNEMAVTSTRSMGVEEISRYAGTFNDPSRMAANFAGVTANAEGDNDIVVRGNSPKGILWRMEGIEIPNPNHFADEGATGGPINALNSNMLANSDFLAGAFEAEYGQAYSGVMDIKLRNGNNQQREYSFSAGVLGMDLTAEGPWKKGYGGSYLVNYRYSSLALLDDFGVVDFGGVPKYQDASFKLIFPTKKFGHFTAFGIGGYSNISEEYFDEEKEKGDVVFRNKYQSFLGSVGLNHGITLGSKNYLKTTASFATNGSLYSQSARQEDSVFMNDYNDNLHKYSLRLQSIFNHKINAQNKLKVGGLYTHHFYNLYSEYYLFDDKKWENDFDEKDGTGLIDAFATWKYRPTNSLTIVSGLHYTQLLLNNDYDIQPRISARWNFAQNQFITAGFGRHSKMESLLTYFARRTLDDGTEITPNKNIKMPKAHHYVVGYENALSKNHHLKIEAYYQDLFDIPIDKETGSTFSTINAYDSYTDRYLDNNGTGRNYGLEFTFERFFDKGFYYMATASVYESKYTAADGQERDTRWNGNYATNFLFGKEWQMGKEEKNRTFGMSSKVMLLGGQRYTGVDLEKSIESGRTIRDEIPFSTKSEDIFQLNASVYYRVNRPKVSHEFKIDVQNATNNQAKLAEYYNPYTEELIYGTQLAIIPNIMYRINF